MRWHMALVLVLTVLEASAIVWRADVEVVETRAKGEMRQAGQLLYSPLRVFGGSCIAIGGEWVLTSRHGTDKWAAELLRVRFPSLGGGAYLVKEVIFPERGDLALLKLSKAVAGAKPIEFFGSDQEVGERVWIGGFGLSGPAGEVVGRGAFHSGHNRIDRIRDGKLTISLGRPGDEAVEEHEATIALLDSGSPMFVQTADGWVLAGIASSASNAADPGYGDRGSYARVSVVREWLHTMVGRPSQEVPGGDVQEVRHGVIRGKPKE